MNTTTFEDAVESIIYSVLRDGVYTIKPATITDIDYDEMWISAVPNTKTKRKDDIQVEFNEAQEVPIFVQNGNAGSARITFPIQKGDNCILLYSDREYGNLLDTDGSSTVDTNERLPFGPYPVLALCGFFTRPNAKSYSSENIEIYNGSTQITIQPSGQVVIDASKVTSNCDLDVVGSITATGSIDAGTSISAGTTVTAGTEVIAGTNVTAGGIVSGVSATFTTSVAAATLAATSVAVTTMTVNGVDMTDHVHQFTYYDTSESGTTTKSGITDASEAGN